jgi:hypothetical protein
VGHHLHADHILPWAKYPGRRYDLRNGRALCPACHQKRHRLERTLRAKRKREFMAVVDAAVAQSKSDQTTATVEEYAAIRRLVAQKTVPKWYLRQYGMCPEP